MNAPQISRRLFLQATAAGGVLALGTFSAGAALGASSEGPGSAVRLLPEGGAPAPVSFEHFPDRVHAFVWRNWFLVPADRMAQVLGASRKQVLRMGRAMGLDGPPTISEDQQRRSYITVIKRNWHLLPYQQLLELLGWTAQRLAFTLREDDFLFVKLGNAKPSCERLRYTEPASATLAWERDVEAIVRKYFPQGVSGGRARPFEFVAELARSPGSTRRARPTRLEEGLRFCYSYFALYGDPLLEPEADPYPEGLLDRLAAVGANGVWLQAVLYKLAPFPWDQELSRGFEERLRNLRRLARRTAKRGIRLFLYLNEPRAMPLSFFERHSLKGVVEGEYATLCTSRKEVQEHLVHSVESICRAVPELGGLFTISASENLTNCWSHGGGKQCSRCAERGPAKVIAEVNRLIAQGIHNSGSRSRLLVWDWGWDTSWAAEAIQLLPREAALMSVSEWQLPIERGGVKSEVGEYSLSAVGPGPRARRHWKAAQERGLRVVAKIQAGNTWELSTLPWIPAVENAARHAENLKREGVRELMLGWTLGGYPSANLEAVSETMTCGSAQEALKRVAERRFGAGLAPAVVAAWSRFSRAFAEYPYHIGVAYSGPQQLGPANLLWEKPTGYRATMVGFPYDDLDSWRSIYPVETYIEQLEKMAQGFMEGTKELRATIARINTSKAEAKAAEEELRMGEAAAIHFRSCANQARFVRARRAKETAGADQAKEHAAEMRRLLEEEISMAHRMHELQAGDSRIGFEASNQYFYLPVDLAEKILNCRELLRRL